MNVVVHPADRGGCGSYRCQWPAEALARQGNDVTLAFDAAYQAIWQPSVFGDRIIGLAETVEADVVVIQRPLTRNRVELIDALQAQGVAVVVEVDDDFHAIHPRNPAWTGTNPLTDPDHNRDWLKRACDRADLVTVTTPALAKRYGSHGRCVILPNYVPARYCDPAPSLYVPEHLERPPGVLVGWAGSVATHPDDLQQCGDAISRVCPNYMTDEDVPRFHVVGTGVRVRDVLGLANLPTATGWLPIEAYPEGLAQLDVGIAPLAPTNFNDAKSCLKGLEMAAVGVPFVASPTEDYRRLADAGIGWLADTPDAWYSLVHELATDPVHREALSLAWQDEIRQHWTIEGNAGKWWDAWGLALEHRAVRAA